LLPTNAGAQLHGSPAKNIKKDFTSSLTKSVEKIFAIYKSIKIERHKKNHKVPLEKKQGCCGGAQGVVIYQSIKNLIAH